PPGRYGGPSCDLCRIYPLFGVCQSGGVLCNRIEQRERKKFCIRGLADDRGRIHRRRRGGEYYSALEGWRAFADRGRRWADGTGVLADCDTYCYLYRQYERLQCSHAGYGNKVDFVLLSAH